MKNITVSSFKDLGLVMGLKMHEGNFKGKICPNCGKPISAVENTNAFACKSCGRKYIEESGVLRIAKF